MMETLAGIIQKIKKYGILVQCGIRMRKSTTRVNFLLSTLVTIHYFDCYAYRAIKRRIKKIAIYTHITIECLTGLHSVAITLQSATLSY